MDKVLLHIFAAAALLCVAANGQGVCNEDDVDPFDMEDMDIYPTSAIGKYASMDDVKEQMKRGMGEAGTGLQAIARNVNDFQKDVENGDLDIDAEVGDPRSAEFQERLKFFWLCPYTWKWINNLRWYFFSAGKFCWSYYPVPVTVCSRRYCGLSSTIPVWSVFYRCFPRYRVIWTYALCLQVNNGQLVWSSQFIRHAVARGCDCRRYFNFQLTFANKCPAVPANP